VAANVGVPVRAERAKSVPVPLESAF